MITFKLYYTLFYLSTNPRNRYYLFLQLKNFILYCIIDYQCAFVFEVFAAVSLNEIFAGSKMKFVLGVGSSFWELSRLVCD
mgnify:CR=1 FL=1